MIQTLGNYALISDSEKGLESISVIGELDLASAHEFENATDALSDSARTVVVDMSGCSYIDSSIVAVLIRANRRFGKKLVLVVPTESPLRKIFNILNLERALRLEPSIEAARPGTR